MKQSILATGLAGLLAIVAGCSSGANTPTSPSAATGGDGTAAADGSTLKATPPALQSPVNGVRIETTKPTLQVGRATGKFVEAQFDYRFEISTPAGAVVHTSFRITGGSETIRYDAPELSLDTRYRWRSRAETGTVHGPWSAYAEFLTIDYRGIVPRPPNGVWPSNGPDVVNYVANAFPEYLARTSFNQRIANMEFLRDRIIETAICGGMDVGHNRKRGFGEHSHDAVAWRDGGVVRVIDIASAFDDPSIELSLHWAEVEGPPGHDGYPNHPGC